MSDEQASYKVTDRRLFNADGTPREVPPEEKSEPIAAPEKHDTTQTVASEETPILAADERTEAVDEAEDEAAGDLPGADDPAGFASFLMSIASNAAAALGMMEHPVTGKRDVDMELGKHWIDVLGMLQQKTRGNLLPQEQQILEGLLADLRMQYVSLTNATPKAQAYSSRDITGG